MAEGEFGASEAERVAEEASPEAQASADAAEKINNFDRSMSSLSTTEQELIKQSQVYQEALTEKINTQASLTQSVGRSLGIPDTAYNPSSPSSLEAQAPTQIKALNDTALTKMAEVTGLDPVEVGQEVKSGNLSEKTKSALDKFQAENPNMYTAIKWFLAAAAAIGITYGVLEAIAEAMSGCYQLNVQQGTSYQLPSGCCNSSSCCNCLSSISGQIYMNCNAGPQKPCPDSNPPITTDNGVRYVYKSYSAGDVLTSIIQTIAQVASAGANTLENILTMLPKLIVYGGLAIFILIVLYFIYKILSVRREQSSTT